MQEKGYVAVVESALVRNAFDARAPNEDLVKCKGMREAVIDDFATAEGEKKLNNATLRSLTGGNTVSGQGKHEKGVNIDTNFLVRMIVNEFPDYVSILKGPDRRRLSLIYYGETFKPIGDPTFDPNNPHHRLQIDFKANIDDFAMEFTEWCRVLASSTKAGGYKFIWPQPASMLDWIKVLIPSDEGTPAGITQKFIEEQLRPLRSGEVPASRDAIIKKLSFLFGGDGTSSNKAYRESQVLLQGELYVSDKKWRKKVAGDLKQINVYRFENSTTDNSVCTLVD